MNPYARRTIGHIAQRYIVESKGAKNASVVLATRRVLEGYIPWSVSDLDWLDGKRASGRSP